MQAPSMWPPGWSVTECNTRVTRVPDTTIYQPGIPTLRAEPKLSIKFQLIKEKCDTEVINVTYRS